MEADEGDTETGHSYMRDTLRQGELNRCDPLTSGNPPVYSITWKEMTGTY